MGGREEGGTGVGEEVQEWGIDSGVSRRTGFGFWCGSECSENAGRSLSHLVLGLRVKRGARPRKMPAPPHPAFHVTSKLQGRIGS